MTQKDDYCAFQGPQNEGPPPRRADGVVIKNSAKVLTTHGPKSTELFLGKVKTYLVF